MSETATAEIIETVAELAISKGEVIPFSPPRLPYHKIVKERFGVDQAGWKALVEAVYPSAKTADSVAMVLSYCKSRNLDPFKKPVHIVPMWSSELERYIETVWPGIAELRTTAFRTGQYAGMEEPEFGPLLEQTFEGTATRGKYNKGKSKKAVVKFPEWCRITIIRELNGKERRFVGPKVYWLESYAEWADTSVPNEMWESRPVGQLEKCAEAAALRRAFPEEIGNDLTAEEMEGRKWFGEMKDVTPAAAPSIIPPPIPPAPPPVQETQSPAQAGEPEVVWEDQHTDASQASAAPPTPPAPPVPPQSPAANGGEGNGLVVTEGKPRPSTPPEGQQSKPVAADAGQPSFRAGTEKADAATPDDGIPPILRRTAPQQPMTPDEIVKAVEKELAVVPEDAPRQLESVWEKWLPQLKDLPNAYTSRALDKYDHHRIRCGLPPLD